MQNIINEFSKLLTNHFPEFFPDAGETLALLYFKESKITLTLPFVCNSLFDEYETGEIGKFLKKYKVELNIQYAVPSILGKDPLVAKNIIAVASGKGGVGKSTTAVNLAFALQKEGAKVGILDADIYGPSVPILMQSTGRKPQILPNNKMQSIDVDGVQSMSIGYLVEEDSANIWRGPMASRALLQIYEETQWVELDYLIVDLPPGTGDIQLTLAQQLPVTGALIITTPQDLSMADAIKGIEMFNKVAVPILGIVENMSFYTCGECGKKEYVFGSATVKKITDKYSTEILQKFPLSLDISHMAEVGVPSIYAGNEENSVSTLYSELARAVSFKVAQFDMENQQIPVVKL